MLKEVKYLLRWKYDYASGNRAGMWSRPGNTPATQAWANNKEGIVRASIEGKDLKTNQVVTLAECDGHDFRTFQWSAVSRVNLGISGSQTPIPVLVGMKLLTSDHEIEVLVDGQVIRTPLKKGVRNLNFATYGK